MRKVIEETDGVSIKQGEITDIIVEDGKVYGVKSYTGAIYPCKVVVLCTGTYLNARCITGETSVYTGPNGLQSATHLTDSLKNLVFLCVGLRQEHLPVWMEERLITVKWNLNTVMKNRSFFL